MKPKLIIWPGIIALCALLIALMWWSNRDAHPTTFPDAKWETRQPAEVGFNTNRLEEFATFVGGHGCLTRFGTMVHTWGQHTNRIDIGSAAKPLYAHMVHATIARGEIPDLDTPVARLVPELDYINKDRGYPDAGITWRHMVQQTACYGVEEAPGAAFNYCDFQTAMLIDTLVHRLHKVSYDRADEILMYPTLWNHVGQQDKPTLAHPPSSLPGRLSISVRDFTRFGLLYMNDGKWGDTQVLPRKVVRMIRSSPLPSDIPQTSGTRTERVHHQRSIGAGKHTPTRENHMNSYSYMWWVNGVMDDGSRFFANAPADTFCALGHGGEKALIIIPSKKIVVCWLDGFRGKWPRHVSDEGHKLIGEALTLLMDAMPGEPE